MAAASKIVSRVKVAAGVLKGIAPGQLIIQFTNQCNASCPQCGMNKFESFPRSTLDTDEVKRIIDAAAQKGVQALSITGGEPLLRLKEVAELLRHAGQAGIEYTRTGTNGFFFANPASSGFEDRVKRVADALAETPLRNFWVSVDSHAPETHEKMRGFSGLVEGMEKAIPLFHERGIYPSANLGINRNTGGAATQSLFIGPKSAEGSGDASLFYTGFKIAFEKFYQFVNSLGFTMVNACYPMSVNPDESVGLSAVYAATSTENITGFSAMEKALLFKALAETISKYRPIIRIFSPVSSLMALHQDYANGGKTFSGPCLGGIDYFFVDAQDGNTYPCGFRGKENLGKFYDLDSGKIDRKASCRLCDWECFRDPSELFRPFMQMGENPLALAGKWLSDSTSLKNWLKDLAYCRACGYFNGRQAPDYKKMVKFAKSLWRPATH